MAKILYLNSFTKQKASSLCLNQMGSVIPADARGGRSMGEGDGGVPLNMALSGQDLDCIS